MAMTEDERRRAVLFNDITYAPIAGSERIPWDARRALTEWLWEQGWRRDVRPEDVNDPRPEQQVWERRVSGTDVPEVRLHLAVDHEGRVRLHEAMVVQLLVDAGWERAS